jgi:hypothetical protein
LHALIGRGRRLGGLRCALDSYRHESFSTATEPVQLST